MRDDVMLSQSADIIPTVTTLCCKTITAELGAASFMENTDQRDILTLTVADGPTKAVELEFDLEEWENLFQRVALERQLHHRAVALGAADHHHAHALAVEVAVEPHIALPQLRRARRRRPGEAFRRRVPVVQARGPGLVLRHRRHAASGFAGCDWKVGKV